MMLRFPLIFYCLLWLFPYFGRAQGSNLGAPQVVGFPKQKTDAGAQSWDISEDERGVIWFANNGGLMEFDGAHWRRYSLSNATIVRSVRAWGSNRVFTGGQDELGCFVPDHRGVMQYQSYKPLLPERDRQFGEVWDIEVLPDGTAFYRTDRQVYRYRDNELTPMFPAGKNLRYMGMWGERLLVQDEDFQFWEYHTGQFQPLLSPAFFNKDIIAAVLEWSPDTLLIATIKEGIFYFNGKDFQPWNTGDDALLRNKRILSASMMPNGQLAIGTALDGLVILDRERRVFHHLNKKNGLQNNTVLSILPARQGGVWLGLDNGIDFADIDAPFSTFYPDGELQGTGYAIQLFENRVYFGANTGLYAIDWKNYYTPSERNKFQRVAQSDGQVWSLQVLGGRLLMGHHEGAFEVGGLSARRLTSLRGVWRFLLLSEATAVAGHYHGFALFRQKNGSWQMDTLLGGFDESSRILALEPGGAVWMAHPYRGIYRLTIDPKRKQLKYDSFDTRQGLPTPLGNAVFQLDGTVLITPPKGVWQYDPSMGRFRLSEQFSRIFGEETQVKYLYQDRLGNIWYETKDETGVLLVEDNTLEKKITRLPIPELRSRLTDGFQCVFSIDQNNTLVASERGFIHFNLEKYRANAQNAVGLNLHEVRLTDPDSVLFGGHLSEEMKAVELPYYLSSLSFSFAASGYPANDGLVRYAYRLDGIGSGEWTGWEKGTEVSFTHLPPGNYTFRVKARNQYGVESPEATFDFVVLPPWYAGAAAYLVYGLLLAGIVIWLLFRQHRRFEQEKRTLEDRHRHREEEHQQQVRRSEAVISQLQQEKLEAEIEHKSEELAAMAMHLVQKNAILHSTQQALDKLQRKLEQTPEVEKEVARIAKAIGNDANLDADWEHFSRNFDQVHRDFLKRLSEKYPGLSPGDYKLCAYLRLNLSSKEIATLMNISLRGVETGRYRLRKRLNLDADANLTDFLMRF